MQTVAQQLGKQQLNTFEESPLLVSADALGIELELEGFTETTRHRAASVLGDRWIVERDGSLRNGGIEFITNGGLGGVELERAIVGLTAFLSETPHDVTFRCSTHMHINMLDFTIPQVVRFILVYTAIEPYLFRIAGNYRYSSNFCTPVAESIPFHKNILSQMHESAARFGNPLRYCNKYTALNISPLFYDPRSGRSMGTLEFRGGRAMTTNDELFKQCNILLSIKKYVREFNGNEEQLLDSISSGVIGTVTPPMDSMEIAEEDRERALMNAWALLKSYQNAQSSQPQVTMQDGFPTSTEGFSHRDLLATLGVTDLNWSRLYRYLPIIRESSNREAVQRSIQCFPPSQHNNARYTLYSELAAVGGHLATRDTLLRTIYVNRHLNSEAELSQPSRRLLGRISDVSFQPLEEILYSFSLQTPRFRAMSQYIFNRDNASTQDVVDWLIDTTVRVKNRDRLNAAIQSININYQVGERENAVTLSRIFEYSLLPCDDFVWRADRGVYTKAVTVAVFLKNTRMRIPYVTHICGMFGYRDNIFNNARYADGDRDEFLMSRPIIQNEIHTYLGTNGNLRLI